MRNKTIAKKKLTLKKESLRTLTVAETEQVAGGISAGCLPFRTFLCPTRPPEFSGIC